MLRAIYPGSFDPITIGHLDIIGRISKMFSSLTVLVAKSSDKSGLFTVEERIKLIQQSIGDFKNVDVKFYEGLTAEYALKNEINTIVRGLRVISDFEYEMSMANMNKNLAPSVETLIIFSKPEYHFISSRLVKEIAMHGGPIQDLVPKQVEKALKSKFSIK